jgi:hypothetical protein
VFCCFLLVIGAVTWFVFPEIKGYSLEKIVIQFDALGVAPGSSFRSAGKLMGKEVEELENNLRLQCAEINRSQF